MLLSAKVIRNSVIFSTNKQWGAAVLDQIANQIHNAFSVASIYFSQLDAGYMRPAFNWLSDNDPQTFYKSLKLNLVMYLLTTVTLGLIYKFIASGMEKRARKRLDEERQETVGPFLDVLVSKLANAQTLLLAALTEQTWEGNWGRPKIRNLASAVGQVEVAFADTLLSYRTVLDDGEQKVFGVYAKLLATLRGEIDKLRIEPNSITERDVAGLKSIVRQIDECLSNLAPTMKRKYSDRVSAARWNADQREDLNDALWRPLEQRAQTNSTRLSQGNAQAAA